MPAPTMATRIPTGEQTPAFLTTLAHTWRGRRHRRSNARRPRRRSAPTPPPAARPGPLARAPPASRIAIRMPGGTGRVCRYSDARRRRWRPRPSTVARPPARALHASSTATSRCWPPARRCPRPLRSRRDLAAQQEVRRELDVSYCRRLLLRGCKAIAASDSSAEPPFRVGSADPSDPADRT